MQKGKASETMGSMRGTAASRLRLTVTEGKYRMVRRVLHNAGHSVLDLHRLRYGGVALGPLDEGDVRPCTAEEEAWAEDVFMRDPTA
jgi:23S rRNA pseudouridine2605 synthase